jgi:MFS family permease
MKAIVASLSHAPAPVFAFLIVGAFWGVFGAYVPEIKAGLGASDAQFGAALLFSGLGLCTSLFLAPIADRMLGPRAMQVGAGLLSLAFLLPASVPNIWTFGLAMFCAAAASGLLDVIMNSRVSELEARVGGSLMNSHHAMFSVGYAFTALLSGPAREFGLPAVMAFAIVAMATVATLSWLKMETQIAEDDPESSHIRMGPVVFWGGLITLSAFMCEGATENWSALHIERTLGGRAAEGAFGPFMLGFTMAIGRFAGQVVVERMSEVRVIIGASLLSALGAAIAAFAPVPLVAYIGFATLGLGVSVVAPMALALVGQKVRARDRTAAISRTAVIGFAGFVIGPPLFGFAAELVSLRLSFLLVAGILAACILWVGPLSRAGRR